MGSDRQLRSEAERLAIERVLGDITPTNADQAGMACSLAFDHPRPTQTIVRPSLQAGGRRFEPSALPLSGALFNANGYTGTVTEDSEVLFASNSSKRHRPREHSGNVYVGALSARVAKPRRAASDPSGWHRTMEHTAVIEFR